jgi:hypothetical protein
MNLVVGGHGSMIDSSILIFVQRAHIRSDPGESFVLSCA